MHPSRTTSFIWFVCLILVASCGVESTDNPGVRSGTMHPTPDNIPGVDEVTHTPTKFISPVLVHSGPFGQYRKGFGRGL